MQKNDLVASNRKVTATASDLDQLVGTEEIPSEKDLVGVDAYLAREGIGGKLSRFYDRIFLWNQRNGGKVVLLAIFLFFSAIGIVVQSMVGPGLGQRPLLKLVFFPEDTSILNVSVNTIIKIQKLFRYRAYLYQLLQINIDSLLVVKLSELLHLYY